MTKAKLTDEQIQLAEIEKTLRALKRQQAIQQARDKFMPFVKFTMPDPADPSDVTRSVYDNRRHHDAVAAALEEVEKGNIQFLILTMPPRHGKTELCSRRFPAWFMGRHPEWSVVVAAYNETLAMDFGAEVRRIMVSPAFKQVFPDVRLTKGGAAKDRLQTERGGMATFVGLGGALTGRGAHCLVLDDLVKDFEEARSKSYRDRAWNWFTKVAMTRRMGPKLVIIKFTRWHQDDIIGRLTDPENEHYNRTLAEKIRTINFPAIAEEDDPLLRKPGEVLWPGAFDRDFLEEQRQMDPLGFESLYQQRPSLADGDMFRRESIQLYDPGAPPFDVNELRIFGASDHAVATGQRSDYTVLLRAGVDKQHNIYILDAWWQKKPTDVVVEAMIQMLGATPRPLIWWAEKGHISKSIGPFLRKRMSETGVYGNIVEVTPSADKAQRAQSISARTAMGKLYLPKGKPCTEKAINELLAFPNGLHDDFVDALAYIGLGLQSQFPVKRMESQQRPAAYGTLGWIKEQQRKQALLESPQFGGF